MAKKVYIGVGGKARKVKKMYFGAVTEVPIYKYQTVTETLSATTIKDFFEIVNDKYYFVGNGTTFTTNNGGVSSSTASTVLHAKRDISALSFNYSYSSESGYDKFTLIVAGTTVADAVSGATTNKTWSGSIAKGQEISFTYAKDSSQNKNDDECTFSNMSVTYEKATVTGYETKSAARKIKKGYIGVGGKARPFWTDAELTYYGTASPLSAGRYNFAATSVGSYALFGGGTATSGAVSTVDAYDTHLTLTNPTSLSKKRSRVAAESVGNYALFAGGMVSDEATNVVDAYDTSLVRTAPTTLGQTLRGMKATTVGDYAVFGGGSHLHSSGNSPSKRVYAYNKSLTRKAPSELSYSTGDAAASTNNYAIFDVGPTVADVYDTSLTKTTTVGTNGASSKGATTLGNYAVFGGGWTAGGVDAVYIYDGSLTQTRAANLSVARGSLTATTVENYAIFAGGQMTASSDVSNVVDVFDESFTRTTGKSLNTARSDLVSATVGSYALFCGGRCADSSYSAVVDVFMV